MQIIRFQSLDDLQPWAEQWNRLAAGIPFRSWQWQTGWWRHYGLSNAARGKGELLVLAAIDEGNLVGLAPWHVERSAAAGAVVRFLGSGDVCSEYQTVLSQPGREQEVAQAIAQWLTPDGDNAARRPDESEFRWDVLELSGVDAEDQTVSLLIDRLSENGCTIHRREGMPCWRLELPADWETYLSSLSKQFRRKARTLDRDFLQTGRAVFHTVRNPDELQKVFGIFVDLHQRRREQFDQPGCFAEQQFANFHRELADQWLASGVLRLHWLEIDGQPAAVEYHFFGDSTHYAYQSGIEPAAMKLEPGHIASVATIRSAIEQGNRAVDFLRGDEPYKSHWRAKPRPMTEFRVAAPTAAARLRHGVWAAGDSLKKWVKSGLELAGVGRESQR